MTREYVTVAREPLETVLAAADDGTPLSGQPGPREVEAAIRRVREDVAGGL